MDLVGSSYEIIAGDKGRFQIGTADPIEPGFHERPGFFIKEALAQQSALILTRLASTAAGFLVCGFRKKAPTRSLFGAKAGKI